MTDHKSTAAAAILSALILALAAPLWLFWDKERKAASFEEKARREIPIEQFQSWATNLLHTNTATERVLNPRFPDPLSRKFGQLYPREPYVAIEQSFGGKHRFVRVIWGGAMGGSWGFVIGDTNFVAHEGKRWADGVYYLKRSSSK